MAMKALPLNISVRELVAGYTDKKELGVFALDGKLNVRPAYQREFVYEEAERDKVLVSIYNGLPLNSMYWAKNPDGSYEVIDGQQRIISICQYITNTDSEGNPIAIKFAGEFGQTFDGLSESSRNRILDYRLQVYLCEGTDDEKLDWFHTINIPAKLMTQQELLNANYTGSWLSDAKKYFSKKVNTPALNISYYDNDENQRLVNHTGTSANRQELLELALQWRICDSEWSSISEYMAKHRDDADAHDLWEYYKSIVSWVKYLFPVYRKDMKGMDWGTLYNRYHMNSYNPIDLEKDLKKLFDQYNEDPDGMKRSGFYEYVLSRDRSLIWRRIFSDKQQRQAYALQGRKCAVCGKETDFDSMEAHHKVAFADGGETTIANCQMLCHDCHAQISASQNNMRGKE